MKETDTICAPATAIGGALSIIRVSGPTALQTVGAVGTVACQEAEANTVHYGHIKDGGRIVDEVMISVFRSPRSYTGEDSVEITCHGSRYILKKVLELLIQHGCRMAEPGEFTLRAYLNGKMDLSQAEAVADLIASTNGATHRMAMNQLRGGISTELSRLREKLLKLTSLLELELDFSDHEDLEFADRSELRDLAATLLTHVGKLADSFETGEAIKHGIPVAIVGKTNVGKSTLLNRLLGDDRAIVSDIHGTTRDTIEDTIDLHGVTFRFIDTAGLRMTDDEVERIGIARTWQAIEKARIVIWLTDAEPTEEEAAEMASRCKGKRLLAVRNKIDLEGGEQEKDTPTPPSLGISAKQNLHIEELKEAIYEAAGLPELQESDVIVSSARHYALLASAHDDLERVLGALEEGLPGDLVAEDLRIALDKLSEITGGAITTDEVLGNIFKNFCVGK